MRHFKLTLAAGVLAGAAFLVPTASQANVVNGTAYFATNAQASDATQNATSGLTVAATFSAPSPLSFDSRTAGNGYTLGGFLATGSATGIAYQNGATSGQSLSNPPTTGTLFAFTGDVTVTSGQTFTVTHDDGLTLDIGGVSVIDTPLPTAHATTTVTYTGPSGNLPFNLVYGECCGAPAVLNISLPLTSVPEPGSLALLGTALAGLGLALGLRRRKAA